uniref:transcription factor E2F1-like n=1 Tax=Semicossyphus pulcher TaxID=241346 RepID=UPI0037E94E55
MVKCVVSGCPNHEGNSNDNLGIFNRRPKKFFSFPKDPIRVKVWLAALRETDKQDSTEQHLICEDHFLPRDISKDGVSSDGIPIMSPYLDGPMGVISSWAAESSEEEDQWHDDDDETYEGRHYGPAKTKPPAPEPRDQKRPTPEPPAAKLPAPEPCLTERPAPDPPAPEPPAPDPPALHPSTPEPPAVAPRPSMNPPMQVPDVKKTSETKTTGKDLNRPKRVRSGVSLATRTQRYLQLLLTAQGGTLDLRQVSTILQTSRTRINEINNVLEGINLVQKVSRHWIKWLGSSQSASSLSQQVFQREMENLMLEEERLDSLIKRCSQQLFDVTDDRGNAALAYVTLEDISRLQAFQEQTVMVIKAPDETKLEVAAPTQDNIQVHLKSGNGLIAVLTCDMETDDATGEESGCFLSLEESQIKTSELQKGSVNSSLPVLQRDVAVQEEERHGDKADIQEFQSLQSVQIAECVASS